MNKKKLLESLAAQIRRESTTPLSTMQKTKDWFNCRDRGVR